MSNVMSDPAATAKRRQKGLSVLDRLAEEQRIAEEKEEARRPRAKAKRSQSEPRREEHGGEEARGRGRQRINEAGTRKDGGADALQRRSRSLVAKKNFRRSVVVNAVAPAGGVAISGCPDRTDAQFEQGTAAGDIAHAAAVREWVKNKLSPAGSELRSIDQKDRTVMLYNDWLEQNGFEPFADWVKDELGWKPVCRVDEELQPKVPTAESMISYAFQLATGDREKCPKGGRAEYRNGEWYKRVSGRRQGDNMTADNAGEFGHGAHADEPSRATSIEQKLSNVATWFDTVLQDTLIANPGRNLNVKKMKKSLAKLLGRARVHEADVLDDGDDAVLEANTNLNSAYETGTLYYVWTTRRRERVLQTTCCWTGRM